MNPTAALPTFRIDPGTPLAQRHPPEAPPVRDDSPALAVVTDLTLVKAATVNPQATLAQAEQTMITQGVRMLFVATELPVIEGLITTTDLHGERQMRRVHETGRRWNELTVADAMTPADALDAVDFDTLRSATVANLIATLQRHGRNHLLVLQRPGPTSAQRVRGIVSRAQIERQLGRPIVIAEIASSFAEIERALV